MSAATQTQDTPKVELGDVVWDTDLGKQAAANAAANGGQQGSSTDVPRENAGQANANQDDTDIVDDIEYLKQQTGLDSWDAVKGLQTRLTELEEKIKNPHTFANDDSRRYYEAITGGKEDDIYDFLHNKRVLSKAADLSSEQAIRLQLQYANKHYTPEDIQDIWEERYAMPAKPQKGPDEEDADFAGRMAEYDAKVAKITRAINRDGVAAKESLGKLKTELIIPEIPKPQAPAGPTEQDQQAIRAYNDAYKASIPGAVKGFNGFSANFKDEEVEIPISYGVAEDEKVALAQEMESFANEGYDANVFLAKRWLNADGTVNVLQMAKDRYLLTHQDKILAKFAQESGAKRLAHERKIKNNVHVEGTQPAGTFTPDNKSAAEKTEEAIWNAK